MSKLAEQKALKAYPIKIDRIYYGLPLINGAEPFTDDVNIQQRNAYSQGYDQAMQYFLEKACKWFKSNLIDKEIVFMPCLWHKFTYKDIEQFKNYMQK